MKISGFTFLRNASTLHYPFKASIRSILPLVDEFIVVWVEGAPEDGTLEGLKSLSGNKLKIMEGEWDVASFSRNTLYAHLTDQAKAHCSGDWLIYLQGDEVIHEDYHEPLALAMDRYFSDSEVEGMLLRYRHFWGDYEHYHFAHNWYPREIRVIRNDERIWAWRDAQSFRKYSHPPRSQQDYSTHRSSDKLKVAALENVWIHHYGGVRPPKVMQQKKLESSSTFGNQEINNERGSCFDFGPLSLLKTYQGTHPQVMKKWVKSLDWQDRLREHGPSSGHEHEKWKERVLGWLEEKANRGHALFGFRNYKVIRKFGSP